MQRPIAEYGPAQATPTASANAGDEDDDDDDDFDLFGEEDEEEVREMGVLMWHGIGVLETTGIGLRNGDYVVWECGVNLAMVQNGLDVFIR